MAVIQSINLEYREGSSDKVYNVELHEESNGYSVIGFNGARGKTLTTQVKTPTPVSKGSAQVIYDTLVQSKLKKGYTETNTSGSNNAIANVSGKVKTGLLPQLLNSIDRIELTRYINDDNYMAQEKYDGRRLMAKVWAGEAFGSNKLGFEIGLPVTVQSELERLDVDNITLDGESIGDYYYVWDVLSLNGQDCTKADASQRKQWLDQEIQSTKYIRSIYTAQSTDEKLALYNKIIEDGGEGIVFKRKDSMYVPGRPVSYGDQVKFKFVETASCIVNKLNDKRSVEIALYEGNDLTLVGNVSIPPNKEMPAKSEVIEVQYLYAFKGGSLFQPVYIGKRDDILPSECDTNQLKYKQELAQAA